MLIAFILMTSGEDYPVYRNLCSYNAAPHIVTFLKYKNKRMWSYAGKNKLIGAIIWFLQSIS